jgi:hypothetical protein
MRLYPWCHAVDAHCLASVALLPHAPIEIRGANGSEGRSQSPKPSPARHRMGPVQRSPIRTRGSWSAGPPQPCLITNETALLRPSERSHPNRSPASSASGRRARRTPASAVANKTALVTSHCALRATQAQRRAVCGGNAADAAVQTRFIRTDSPAARRGVPRVVLCAACRRPAKSARMGCKALVHTHENAGGWKINGRRSPYSLRRSRRSRCCLRRRRS